VAVVGQGVVGLLVTSLLARHPLEALVAIEPAARRARLARALGAHAVLAPGDPPAASLGRAGADLTYELTGDPAALDLAVRLTGREGRVVVGSFYGRKRHPVDLGDHFHRGRLTIVSSQVSHIGPALAGRWDRARRADAAFRALATLDTAALITHRFPLADAQAAYALLEGAPQGAGAAGAGERDVVQVLFVHGA
jgi:threonine dehydrogenase-like Zn-dependent dehydrogenase